MGRPIPGALQDALDCSSVEPGLRRLVEARFGPGARLDGLRAELVKRRVVRYALTIARPGGGTSWPVIGKVYESSEEAVRAFHRQRWLRGQGFARASSVSVPEAYAHCADARTLFMEEVGGESLKRRLKSGPARVEDVRLFAEALARLHLVEAVFGEPFTLADHLERRCAGLSPDLARAFPELARGIERIVETARGQPEEATALAHGDYHPGQVHIEGDRVWILDLDPLHRGAPAYDLAMVLVMLALLEPGESSGCVHALGTAFLEHYFARIPPERAHSIPIQAALVLLKRACKRFRWQDEPGWEETVRRQIRCAAAFAELQSQLPRPRALADVLALYQRLPPVA